MSAPYIDTDAIVRFITGDHAAKRRAVAGLLRRIERGEIELIFPDIIIADILFVLCSRTLYNMPRADAVGSLSAILRLPRARVHDKRTMLDAMSLFETTRLGFGDCYLIASMRQSGVTTLYSYDRDFDRFADIERIEP